MVESGESDSGCSPYSRQGSFQVIKTPCETSSEAQVQEINNEEYTYTYMYEAEIWSR